MDAISIGITDTDEELSVISLQTLAEVPLIGYNSILSYLQKIGQMTMDFLNNKKTDQLKYCLLFWLNLSKEEIRLKPQVKMIENYIKDLLTIIMSSMQINEFEDDEHTLGDLQDEKYTVLEAASNLLMDVAELKPSESWESGY